MNETVGLACKFFTTRFFSSVGCLCVDFGIFLHLQQILRKRICTILLKTDRLGFPGEQELMTMDFVQCDFIGQCYCMEIESGACDNISVNMQAVLMNLKLLIFDLL